MNVKRKIYTISYFDVNQKNGGAIFAKNMNTFLNETELFESEVYCNHRKVSVETKKGSNINLKDTSFKEKIKNTLKESKTFELLIHFVRNDFNAIILAFKLFLTNKIKKHSILLFHDHLSLFYFSLFFSLEKRKVVLIMHNDGSPVEMISSGIKSNFKRKILDKISTFQIKVIVSKLEKVVFLCDNAKNKFVKLYNLNIEKTTTIPNGIIPFFDTHQQTTSSDKIRFITVCTMNERKGIDTFIKCLPILNQNFADKIEFTLLGQGPLLNDLKQLSLIYNNLNVIGESDKVAQYLYNSDVFFLLSTNEGQPLSILEALRASLFIFATNVGCNASMVKPINGLLTEVDQHSILNGFTSIIANWESLKSRREHSFKLFNDTFTEDKMYQSYLKTLTEIE
jgi:glycosyltransferase involved in cell wall biosynthesis